ncbi:MAG: pirin family protein [Cyanobacteria bacterium CRU_2_1]|nr:pirin family protein [Cyanobacteria bacterium RU_5_0]NJR57684.1 pirin family protein [Cyanobacteria bacterium CRU_2_1]
MITVRPANERGHVSFGWLNSYHSFSFGNYYDPNHMGFRALRVINDDQVKPGAGFDTHPHRDMEILTYVLSGSLTHRDSMGNTATIGANEVQRITAGTGIFHSEFNKSATEPVHLLQIWILPDQRGLPPSYQEQSFPAETRRNQWRQIAGRDAKDGAVQIHQDVDLYASLLTAGDRLSFPLRSGRHAWLQVAQGKISLNGISLEAGDGAAINNETLLDVQAHSDTEVLLFDLA